MTIVGPHLSPVAIYTAGEASIDWRKHQLSDAVRFVSEPLDDSAARSCFEIVRSLGLRYGAIDLIETADGTIYFLEVNANGQDGWLEKQLGLPISEHLAQELLAIRKDSLQPSALTVADGAPGA